MLTLACHCGRIHIELQKRPDFIHECNCSLCSKSGARWGYFHPSEVTVDGDAAGYCRSDKDQPNARIRFCDKCGSTTHFELTENAIAKFGNNVMGVNMWLANADDLAGIELRYPDGRNWSGDTDFTYVRDAHIIG